MFKTRPVLNWQIREHGDLWDPESPQAEPVQSHPLAAHRPQGSRCAWRSALVLALLILLPTGTFLAVRLWQKAQNGLERVEADIQQVVELESWLVQNGGAAQVGALLDDQAPDSWRQAYLQKQTLISHPTVAPGSTQTARVEGIELAGELALVEVAVTHASSHATPSSYHEVRFYRQTAAGWVRTAPVPDFWGPRRLLETAHFRLLFRQRDNEAVEAVAAGIEGMYTGLYEKVGLEPPADPAKLTIEVVPETLALGWLRQENRLLMPSPLLLELPEGTTRAVALNQLLQEHLSRYVLDEVVQRDPVGWESLPLPTRSEWKPMLEGLRLWMVWEGDAASSYQRVELESSLRGWLQEKGPPRLQDLILPEIDWPHGAEPTANLAAATVFEYAAQTYGRERLPALLVGFRAHTSWEGVLLEAYGVPSREFEAGWQAYLAERYGLEE